MTIEANKSVGSGFKEEFDAFINKLPIDPENKKKITACANESFKALISILEAERNENNRLYNENDRLYKVIQSLIEEIQYNSEQDLDLPPMIILSDRTSLDKPNS